MNKKTTQLDPITTLSSDYLIQVVDTGDYTMAPEGTNKKITAKKFIDSAIADVLTNGFITASKIAESTITAGKIAGKTITATQIADKTITAAQIADKTITAAQIADKTITATQIADATIGDAQLASNIPQSKIVDLTSALALKANLSSPNFGGTPIAPTAAANTSTTQLATTEFVTNAITNQSQLKNRVINGNFDVWQRGTSSTVNVTATGTRYLADRWIALTGIPSSNSPAGTCSVTRQACTSTENSLFKANYYQRLTNSISSIGSTSLSLSQQYANGNLAIQSIEDAATILGKTVTLSFWARASAPTKIFSESQIHSSSVPLWTPTICKTFDLTTSWQKYTHTYVIPTYSQVVAAAYNPGNLDLGLTNPVYTPLGESAILPLKNWLFQVDLKNMWSLGAWKAHGNAYATTRPSGFEGTHQTLAEMQAINNSLLTNGWYDIAQIQLEEGPVATSFEQRPIGLELNLCQRYFETGKKYESAFGAFGSGTNFLTNEIWVDFKVKKRISPIITFLNQTHGKSYPAGVANPGHADSSNVEYLIVNGADDDGFMASWKPYIASADAAPNITYQADAEIY